MSFLDFTNTPSQPLTPAQLWAQQTQNQSKQVWSDFFNFVSTVYTDLWSFKDENPQGVVDRVTALGTGAQSAFALHAAAVGYFVNSLAYITGLDSSLVDQIQSMTVPSGWTISFNNDGSATVTPPAQAKGR